jgi:hypothetical protein
MVPLGPHAATVQPWFIATEPFGPWSGDAWSSYVAWSGLSQLRELVSLDETLCPTALPDIAERYWPHIVTKISCFGIFATMWGQ